jgi:hypothetical protein
VQRLRHARLLGLMKHDHPGQPAGLHKRGVG